MQREGDDDVWRSIVENFGERASLDPEDEAVAPPPPARPDPRAWEEPDDPAPTYAEDVDAFVPPEPPPLPVPEPDRGIAWVGVIGSPLLLLVSLVLCLLLIRHASTVGRGSASPSTRAGDDGRAG